MITPTSLALVLGRSIIMHDAKKPALARALGNNNEFPYPTHLRIMVEMYDQLWMVDRASDLVDNALMIKFDHVQAKLREFEVIKELIRDGGLTLQERRLQVQRSMEITKEIETIVEAMEGVSNA